MVEIIHWHRYCDSIGLSTLLLNACILSLAGIVSSLKLNLIVLCLTSVLYSRELVLKTQWRYKRLINYWIIGNKLTHFEMLIPIIQYSIHCCIRLWNISPFPSCVATIKDVSYRNKIPLKTSRVYCSKHQDHTGSFQSQHSNKRDLQYTWLYHGGCQKKTIFIYLFTVCF